ncbi:MAG: iron ABC transporter permease [Planctomycetota bacterium]
MSPGARFSVPPRRGTRPLAVALAALPLILALAVLLGVQPVPLGDSLRVALAALGLGDDAGVPDENRLILTLLRPPRVAVLALAGAALAGAGAALQATFQNPMADPGILGISSGGTLGAVLAYFLGWGEAQFLAVPASAFAGAVIASLLVYFLAHAGGRPTTTSLLLTGIAVGALLGAGSVLVQTWVPNYRLQEILFWMVGGARDRTWVHSLAAGPPIAVGLLGLLALHRPMDALALGEEHALSVGVAVHRTRMLLLALSALVAGAAVSVCGPIGFVGLIVPHVARLVVGPRSRVLVPMSVIVGAEFLVLCDLVARMLSGERVVHLGVLTAFLGVPFFLALLARAKRLS